MPRKLVSLLLLAVPFTQLLLTGCGSRDVESASARATGGPLSGQLVLTGSSTVAPLATEIGKLFETLHPDVRVDVQSGGSSRGIADARSGVADIGMASRALKSDELAEGLVTHQIAVDGVCLIVHKDNPIETLTDAQVVAIYTGAIENWADVGGADREIVVANKAEGRATLEVFLGYFKLDNIDVKADLIVGENQHAIKTVAGNVAAIAYVSVGEAERVTADGTPIKLLAAGGVEATTTNVGSGRFPITRPLNLVTLGEPGRLTREFISFAESTQVHPLVDAAQFVPVQR